MRNLTYSQDEAACSKFQIFINGLDEAHSEYLSTLPMIGKLKSTFINFITIIREHPKQGLIFSTMNFSTPIVIRKGIKDEMVNGFGDAFTISLTV